MDNENKLGELISKTRINKGLSQRELAKQIDIDNSGLAKIENGQRKKPNVLTLKKLSSSLDIDYSTLLSFAGYDNNDINLSVRETEEVYSYVLTNILKEYDFMKKPWYKKLDNNEKNSITNILNDENIDIEDNEDNQITIFDKCKYKNTSKMNINEIMEYFDLINEDKSHMLTNDDICTPMQCVKTMVDYIPKNFFEKDNIEILDPCSGNGNFGAYLKFFTNENNIWYNELNPLRYYNCKTLLNPKHIDNEDFFKMTGDFNRKYDLIIANPPYSGGGNKNRSLSNLFIEHSIDLLNDNGYLCFITPNNWMTYNNNNVTLHRLLNEGSFLVIDNDCKKYFNGIGSSFTIIVWQKGNMNNKTLVKNNFLIKDIQKNVVISSKLKCIPLYISQETISIFEKVLGDEENNRFHYRCDLHNFTQKKFLSDIQNDTFKYRTIHTARKTRYASKKQDIYDKWNIIIPLSTYYIPFIDHNANVTQSVGYISFETNEEATKYLEKITQNFIKVVIHLTRYGNFNNIMVLKHIKLDSKINFTEKEQEKIEQLVSQLKY